MHDIDRTQYESGGDAFESDAFEFAPEGEGEIWGEADQEGPFTEAEEMELAADLLEVTDEAELDQFLGKLLKKAGRAVGKFARGPLRAVGGVLKGIAKKALPFVGGALGSFIPIPGVGTAVGTALGTAASKLFEMDLEGLSPEEQEFEVARQFVRLAGAAAQQAAAAPPNAPPQAVARAAVMAAARKHAPGLVRPAGGGQAAGTTAGGARRGGRWIRRGRKIVLLGV